MEVMSGWCVWFEFEVSKSSIKFASRPFSLTSRNQVPHLVGE